METLTLARYILETSLMDYDLIEERDSKMAAAALLLALKIKGMSWVRPSDRVTRRLIHRRDADTHAGVLLGLLGSGLDLPDVSPERSDQRGDKAEPADDPHQVLAPHLLRSGENEAVAEADCHERLAVRPSLRPIHGDPWRVHLEL